MKEEIKDTKKAWEYALNKNPSVTKTSYPGWR